MKALYRKRYAIERVFKSMKESRRLERHCVRGLRQITLHSLMSTIAFQATVLARLLEGEPEWDALDGQAGRVRGTGVY